ncbi:unnamed protein product [Sphagnum balticum]
MSISRSSPAFFDVFGFALAANYIVDLWHTRLAATDRHEVPSSACLLSHWATAAAAAAAAPSSIPLPPALRQLEAPAAKRFIHTASH